MMMLSRLIGTCLIAVVLGAGLAQPASAQMYRGDATYDDRDEPLPPVSHRLPSRRDVEAAYPSSEDDDYGDARSPVPNDASPRRRGGYSESESTAGRVAAGGPRSLRPDEMQMTRQVVEYTTNQAAGTIVVDTRLRKLFYVMGDGRALQYGIGVGREGFAWKGLARVGRKAEWPDWIPPADMLARRPELPIRMEGGIANPLGARALYLFQGNADTLYRIHGTNEPESIGHAMSSGCIRMLNADVVDLYGRIPVNTRVVVL